MFFLLPPGAAPCSSTIGMAAWYSSPTRTAPSPACAPPPPFLYLMTNRVSAFEHGNKCTCRECAPRPLPPTPPPHQQSHHMFVFYHLAQPPATAPAFQHTCTMKSKHVFITPPICPLLELVAGTDGLLWRQPWNQGPLARLRQSAQRNIEEATASSSNRICLSAPMKQRTAKKDTVNQA